MPSKIENWRSFAAMVVVTVILLLTGFAITWAYIRFVGDRYGSHASEAICGNWILVTLVGMGWVVARNSSVTRSTLMSSLLAGICVSMIVIGLEFLFRGDHPQFFQVIVIYFAAITCLMTLGAILQGLASYFFQ